MAFRPQLIEVSDINHKGRQVMKKNPYILSLYMKFYKYLQKQN